MDGTCKFNKDLSKVTVKSFVDVQKSDADLAKAIAEGPVSVGVAANS